MSECVSECMSEHVCECMTERVSACMSECVSARVSEWLSDGVNNRIMKLREVTGLLQWYILKRVRVKCLKKSIQILQIV